MHEHEPTPPVVGTWTSTCRHCGQPITLTNYGAQGAGWAGAGRSTICPAR